MQSGEVAVTTVRILVVRFCSFDHFEPTGKYPESMLGMLDRLGENLRSEYAKDEKSNHQSHQDTTPTLAVYKNSVCAEAHSPPSRVKQSRRLERALFTAELANATL